MRLCDGGGHTVYWVFARLRLGFDRLQAERLPIHFHANYL